VSGLDRPSLLACDGSTLYWVGGASGDVYRSNIDGANVAVFAPSVAGAVDVEVGADGLLFALGGAAGRIVRVPEKGGSVDAVAATPNIRGLAVVGNHVYWFSDSEISDESGVVHVADTPISDIAADADGIYYADRSGVWAVPLAGGDARRLAGTFNVGRRVMSAEPDTVVWGSDSALMRVTKDGGQPEAISRTPALVVATLPGAYAWLDGDEVRVLRDGEEERAIAPADTLGGVALCGGYVFWASRSDGTVSRAAQ
jgi:hypothetical protein